MPYSSTAASEDIYEKRNPVFLATTPAEGSGREGHFRVGACSALCSPHRTRGTTYGEVSGLTCGSPQRSRPHLTRARGPDIRRGGAERKGKRKRKRRGKKKD